MSLQELSLVENMLLGLANAKKSVERQSGIIAEIVDKSNNTLLQIESSKSKVLHSPSDVERVDVFACNKETVLTLARLLEQFQHVLNGNSNEPSNLGFSNNLQKYLEQNQQQAKYLGSNVRKLLAASDKITQIEKFLHEEWDESDHDEP